MVDPIEGHLSVVIGQGISPSRTDISPQFLDLGNAPRVRLGYEMRIVLRLGRKEHICRRDALSAIPQDSRSES